MYVFASTILFYEAYFVKCVRRACYKNIWDIHLPFQMLSSESLCLILKFRRKLNFNSLSLFPALSLSFSLPSHVYTCFRAHKFGLVFPFSVAMLRQLLHIPHLRFFWFFWHPFLASTLQYFCIMTQNVYVIYVCYGKISFHLFVIQYMHTTCVSNGFQSLNFIQFKLLEE